MARDFNASGRLVNHGSAANIDDIPSGGALAFWIWVFRVLNGNNQIMISKRNTQGWAASLVNGPGEGAVRFTVERNTTDTDYVSNSGIVPLYVWKFIGGYWDTAATPQMKLYHGGAGLADTVVEVGSYTTSQAGSGTAKTDAASNLYVGNIQVSDLPFLGLIQRGGIFVPASTPTSSTFETIRAASIETSSTTPTTTRINAAIPGTNKLAFDYEGSSLTDFSGNANNGTVTGATVSDLLCIVGLPQPPIGLVNMVRGITQY